MLTPLSSEDMGPATPLVLDSMESEPNPFLQRDPAEGELAAENVRARGKAGGKERARRSEGARRRERARRSEHGEGGAGAAA